MRQSSTPLQSYSPFMYVNASLHFDTGQQNFILYSGDSTHSLSHFDSSASSFPSTRLQSSSLAHIRTLPAVSLATIPVLQRNISVSFLAL
ncbi:unnamed protein product [Haemonchus placei]|uniref:Uncharacterized protein n=1 Tax=Haemonchus placei TaxID=6290 RepID=A0A3P7UFN1_HAEPC|nr:unnamed protein product [Haemonchus placei]